LALHIIIREISLVGIAVDVVEGKVDVDVGDFALSGVAVEQRRVSFARAHHKAVG